ncbi:hypothetical protein SAMN04488519_106138 [Algoriphagus ornithinivorans]|uniref:Uncharacterized protein n=1 Tax=Algoriphagus ornithinivorans TaxID=226506 RepID=A0A1I5GXN1_9BACT|nr:hypothetical protein SAMN04488519_106138 [Algoriphagus ornithinivorans]
MESLIKKSLILKNVFNFKDRYQTIIFILTSQIAHVSANQ